MKLNSLLLLIVFGILVVSSLVFFVLTKRSVQWSRQKIAQSQARTLKGVIEDTVLLRKSHLQNVSQLIQSDANFASAFVLAQSSNDFTMFNEMIEDLRKRSGLEEIYVMPLEAPAPQADDWRQACLVVLNLAGSQEGFCRSPTGPVLGLTTSLDLYGEKAGVLFLAISLEASSLKQLGRSAETIQLSTETSEGSVLVASVGESKLYGYLQPDFTELNEISAMLMRNISWASLVTFVLMLGLFAWCLDRFFLKGFRDILMYLGRASADIERDVISEMPPVRLLVAENRRLAASISVFVLKFMEFQNRLSQSNRLLLESEKKAALNELARKVAHDIQAPLMALRFATRSTAALPDSFRRVLMGAADRINGIAGDLLERHRYVAQSETQMASNEAQADLSNSFLYIDIEAIVSEKRSSQLRDSIQIEFTSSADAYLAHAAMESSKFKRILSNLLDNAIESLEGSTTGQIRLELKNLDALRVELRIKDNGCGIPPEVLSELGRRELSHGKKNGNGIGVFYAAKDIRELGGVFEIESEVGKGTEVILVLPRVAPPLCMLSVIPVDPKKEIVVVDDDKTVHEVWRQRLEELALTTTVRVLHRLSPADFGDWRDKHSEIERYQFFVDYEFEGSAKNGLDLIRDNGLEKYSILVTGRFAELKILREVSEMGVKLIAKPLLNTLPLAKSGF